MGRHLHRRTATFIVRIWAEYLAETPPAWRGEVEQVGSGVRLAFRDLAGIAGFIESRLCDWRATSEPDGAWAGPDCERDDRP